MYEIGLRAGPRGQLKPEFTERLGLGMGVLCSDTDCSPQVTKPFFYTANSRADKRC